MIWLFNSKSRPVGSYNSFEEVCDHFKRLEHLKPLPTGRTDAKKRWDFIYWSHKKLSILHEHFKDTHFNELEREAYERELDLIEIFDGRSPMADQYIVTEELDIGGLMREWCFDYAYAHGYTVLETYPSQHPKSFPLSRPFTSHGLGYQGQQATYREGA